MRVEIRKLQRRLKTTSVYVTHDQLEAMTLADMLVVMNGGRMEQCGAPLEVYERPASLFVASFIGSPPMNFLKGTVEAKGAIRLADGSALAYDPAHIGAAAGAKVVAGVRPELVGVGDAGGLDMPIELIEELGTGRLVHGRLGEEPFTVLQGPGVARPNGERLRLSIAPGTVHLFDAGTGMRL